MTELKHPVRNQPLIDRLTAVVRSENMVRSRHFIGFTSGDLPLATGRINQLSANARASFDSHEESDLQISLLPYIDIEPMVFRRMGTPLEYDPEGGLIPEDLIPVTIVDSTGKERIVTFPELAVLEGITENTTIWQDQLPSSQLGGPQKMYTTFIHPEHAPAEHAYALLFEPPLIGVSNISAFHNFTRDVLGNLIDSDISRKTPILKRGYLWEAVSLTNPQSWLHFLKSLPGGMDDETIARINRAPNQFLCGALRLMRAVHAFDISDERLLDIANADPLYDLEKLDTSDLISLAAAMRKAALVKLRSKDI